MRRRELLLGGAAAGAMLALTPKGALAHGMLRTADGAGTSRASRLHPDDGLRLAHTDLHNHTLLSDGAADVEGAFAQLRAAGLDVAALTDHAVLGSLAGDSVCGSCSAITGFDDPGWARTKQLADAATVPDQFVALRGFEWTTPHLGHINVWFSEQWIDPVSTGSLVDPDALLAFLRDDVDQGFAGLASALAPVVPPTSTIDGFYAWLQQPVTGTGLGGGGADALAGFNHPNGHGNFNDFQFFGEVRDRMVSVELFNGPGDYLFRGLADGEESPVNAILNAGWRVGSLGVTDEHSGTFDVAEGKGRAGLWLRSLTRDGVREALEARRFFATRLTGLRLDATAAGVRMGGDVAHRKGTVPIRIDVDKGPQWHGKHLLAQLLVAGPAGGLPVIAHVERVTVPGPDQPVVAFDVPLDAETSPWALLRLSDPEAPAEPYAVDPFRSLGRAVAYASPWFLRPDLAGA
ncbi:MAG TPA: hypothetical protein VJ804_11750, partial [Acidimicrobiales bacterium]|nr:hypothetical protein [Acidimicrobiales bacterium]